MNQFVVGFGLFMGFDFVRLVKRDISPKHENSDAVYSH